MPKGAHSVTTAWTLAEASLEAASDPRWAADRAVIEEALGKTNSGCAAHGIPAPNRQTRDQQRERMLDICAQCHSDFFSRHQLEHGDRVARESNHVMAEAVRTVMDLYRDGTLRCPNAPRGGIPILLTGKPNGNDIENRLFAMYLGHRMHGIEGTFHCRSQDALWWGWSELDRDLVEIKSLALELREQRKRP